MKTTISNKTNEALEIAKHVMYSIQVLAIGLFIPFSFIFGITYKRHDQMVQENANIKKEASAFQRNLNNTNTVNFMALSDQNS